MTPGTPTTGRRRSSTPRVALRLARNDPAAYLIAWAGWVAFYSAPLATAAVVRLVLDRVAGGDAGGVWLLLGALAGVEVVRWTMVVAVAVQWHGCWVGWQTVPRVNLLRSLAEEPGPAAGRLPGAPGEAVSRFRDDVEDLALVLDVWLDISGALVSSALAVAVLVAIDPGAALAIAAPVALAALAAWRLGPRLRAWRRAAREATARVTGFIGDTFGAVSAVQSAGAEQAVHRRFVALNAARAVVGRRDQVGSELVRSLGYGTGEVAVGAALVVVAAALGRGDLSVGDVALFAAYAAVIAEVPKWVGRSLVYHRQADVSVDRLAELLRTPDRRAVVAPTPTHLRQGPPPLATPADGEGRDHPAGPLDEPLEELRVEGLTVHHPGSGRGVEGVDLLVRRGELVVLTGPIGAGKTTVLRALLGLVAADGGTVRWNGALVPDPSVTLVPPRVAYLPQVPRLFSEPPADTILLGAPPDRLGWALWAACLDEDVARLPAGTATDVGPRGLRLSGGQAQRVGLARALVRAPDLLVVDDLSSALDTETESRLWSRLAAGGFTTALVVSHRPHVLEAADRVVVLADGRVVEVR